MCYNYELIALATATAKNAGGWDYSFSKGIQTHHPYLSLKLYFLDWVVQMHMPLHMGLNSATQYLQAKDLQDGQNWQNSTVQYQLILIDLMFTQLVTK